ncbi:MAG TPA: nitroreductase family deazaflavin-dependent oxidoreductase [Acidimicrobiales bacterium]|jgi:deazaflavin-dependent oxidoreductase (nitroreductase family)
MPLDGTYEPSTWDLVANQVSQYEASGGQQGGTLEGKPCVILWTRGRRSGSIRKSALMRVEHEGTYAVVASMGGAPMHPQWYLNLVADPEVTLQDGAEVFDFQARTATPQEKAQWWPRATEVWPPYDDYQRNTDRDIPLVLLEKRN